jgi:hypothetical protein
LSLGYGSLVLDSGGVDALDGVACCLAQLDGTAVVTLPEVHNVKKHARDVVKAVALLEVNVFVVLVVTEVPVSLLGADGEMGHGESVGPMDLLVVELPRG